MAVDGPKKSKWAPACSAILDMNRQSEMTAFGVGFVRVICGAPSVNNSHPVKTLPHLLLS